jgi:outer membrane protein insertion porin family
MSLISALTFAFLVQSAPTVRDIVIQGNTRTKTYIIRNEIETRPGDPFSPALWEADVQRVRDLGIFWTTAATATTSPAGTRLFLTVEEKWTLIPLFGFSRAGAVTEWSGGLYDANFLGRNTRAGFEFSRKRGGNTFDISVAADRVGRSPLYYQVEILEAHNLHTVYDQADRRAATAVGEYETRSAQALAEGGLRLDAGGNDTLGLYTDARWNRHNLLDHTAEERAINAANAFEAPPERVAHRLGVHLKAGKLHYQDYLYEGSTWNVFASESYQALGTPRFYPKVSADLRRFWVPFRRHNVGIRLLASSTGSTQLEDRVTLGGLGEIRGFPDERFAGRQAWLANAEYRYPVIDNRYTLVQGTGFSDAGSAWDGGFLARDAVRQIALSTGVGVRAIVKPIISMMVRFDVAWTALPYRSKGFSLGITQFF